MDDYKLQIAMGVLQKWVDKATCGIFKSRNVVGDRMDTIYDNEELGLTIDICFGYEYFEVFGLTDEEFEAVKKYYNFLAGKKVETPNEVLDDIINGAGQRWGYSLEYDFDNKRWSVC